VRVGVVGVGSMGQNHARVYSEIAELVGVVDADPETAKRVAARLECDVYADVKDLIEAGVEAASVAVPTHYHRRVAMELIEAGVQVVEVQQAEPHRKQKPPGGAWRLRTRD